MLIGVWKRDKWEITWSESEMDRLECEPPIEQTFIHFVEKSASDGVKDDLFLSDSNPPGRFLSTPRCCGGTIDFFISYHWQPANVQIFQQEEKNGGLNNFFIKKKQKMIQQETFATFRVKGSNIKKCSSSHLYNAMMKNPDCWASYTDGASCKMWK